MEPREETHGDVGGDQRRLVGCLGGGQSILGSLVGPWLVEEACWGCGWSLGL